MLSATAKAPLIEGRPLIAAKAIHIDGDKGKRTTINPGEVFDTSLVTPRRLDQLYRSNFLAMEGAAVNAAKPPPKKKAGKHGGAA